MEDAQITTNKSVLLLSKHPLTAFSITYSKQASVSVYQNPKIPSHISALTSFNVQVIYIVTHHCA